MNPAAPAEITCFLLKVHSRCNLACDYCYVYEHADQSWRSQPYQIADEIRDRVVDRIADYVSGTKPRAVSVILHGGEPMLCGAPFLAATAQRVRSAIGHASPSTRVEVGLQTNGVLLDKEAVALLASAEVGISLSLDGPPAVHDRHRIRAGGKATSSEVMKALGLLRSHPGLFRGVIAVIDADSDPKALVEWFAQQDIPALDFLLPDAHHARPPVGRRQDPDRYAGWLLSAFDVWFEHHPELPIRTFDAVVQAICGLPSTTDAFGLGDVNLLTIETDGSYHDLDVLKITTEGQSGLGLHTLTASIAEAAATEKIAAHRRLLTYEGLSPTCRACPEAGTCGGGSVPHRWDGKSFDNPSVYCHEMLALFSHARSRLKEQLEIERAVRTKKASAHAVDFAAFDSADCTGGLRDRLIAAWQAEDGKRLRRTLDRLHRTADMTDVQALALGTLLRASDQVLGRLAVQPGLSLWLRAAEALHTRVPLRTTDGSTFAVDLDYLVDTDRLSRSISEGRDGEFRLHHNDRYVRAPFAEPIEFLGEAEAARLTPILLGALGIIRLFKPHLYDEMLCLSPEIQLIRDHSADPAKIVSFSDDIVPGALFVSAGPHDQPTDELDLADSLIHEHRHQKLYLLSRGVDLVENDGPLVRSPWREDLRPPSGVVHAVWVFTELLDFWMWVRDSHPEASSRASSFIEATRPRLELGWQILDSVPLTPAGRGLILHLRRRGSIQALVLPSQ